MTGKLWHLYMRGPDDTSFQAVDWSTGAPAKRLIYASIFTDKEREAVQEQLNLPQNSHIDFSWRKVIGT